MQVMKAIQITQHGGPEVLQYVELPVPHPPSGRVLVRISTIGVGKPDVLLRTGVYKWKPPLPALLGAEGAGVVEEIGPDVDGFSVGDRVLVSYAPLGCYAEYVIAPVRNLLKLPAGLSFEQAIHVPNYVSAYALLHDAARGVEADVLYINGAAGGVGLAVIELANGLGTQVIAGASTEEKCAFLRQHGAAHTINYGKQAVVAEVLRLTNGRGVPLILDHLIGPRFTDMLDALAPLGMIVSFNALLGFPQEDLFVQMRAHLVKSPAVRCFSGHVYDENPARLRQIQAAALDHFVSGKARPTVHEIIPLAQARRAHELLDSGKVLGKLILRP